MAQITLNIPDNQVQRVIHALCLQARLEETPENAKKQLIDMIRRLVVEIESREALMGEEMQNLIT